MKRFLIFLFSSLLFTCYGNANPADPALRTFRQKDGTQIQVRLQGDEHFHYYVTADGMPVARAADGSFYYLSVCSDTLGLSSRLAHSAGLRRSDEQAFLKANVAQVKAKIAPAWRKRRQARLAPSRKLPRSSRTFSGEKRALVILVNFADKTMHSPMAQAHYNDYFNKPGYNHDGAVGSVRDYFYDQSYGNFTIYFDVLGPVTVSKPYGYYGGNTSLVGGNDKAVREMVEEACILVDEQVDFSAYDWDGDGEVEQVFFIYAGYGESDGGDPATIWPHKYYLSQPLMLDGVSVSTYACSNELSNGYGTDYRGIGTTCHEFSHCLGLPDTYDVNYNGGFGMSYWDLMSSGGHSGPKGNGEVPCGYTAFERWCLGWLQPKVLTEPCRIENMPPLDEDPEAYVIYNDAHPQEFFILENRSAKKWYSYLAANPAPHGLLISHIDYDQAIWDRNDVNIVVDHQRNSIVPADMSYGYADNDLQGDLFPGSNEVTDFTDLTHVYAGGKLFNPNTDGTYKLRKPVTRIYETEERTICFDFRGGCSVSVPVVHAATEITDTSFVANWFAPEAEAAEVNPESYTLELAKMLPKPPAYKSVLLSDGFNKFKTGANTADGFEDLSAKLDKYTQTPGWIGEKVFTSPKGVKLGTSSVSGFLITPKLPIMQSGITIQLKVRGMTPADSLLLLDLVSIEEEEVVGCRVRISPGEETYVLHLSGADLSNCRLRIKGAPRLYLSGFTCYDGLYEAEELSVPILPSAETFSEFDLNYYETIRIVKGITDTFLPVKGLAPGTYRYRICGNVGTALSDWSEYADVILPSSVGILTPAACSQSPVYYSVDGRRITKPQHSGVYLEQVIPGGRSRRIFYKAK